MKLCTLLAVALFPLVASAQQAGAVVWKDVGLLTNCSTASLATAITGCEVRRRATVGLDEITGVKGYNLLTLELLHTYAAGTGITFFLESCNEGLDDASCTDSTDWYRVQAISVSAGVGTLTDFQYSKTTGSTKRFAVSIGINYQRLRLAAITAGGSPTSSDKFSAYARLGVSPAF